MTDRVRHNPPPVGPPPEPPPPPPLPPADQAWDWRTDPIAVQLFARAVIIEADLWADVLVMLDEQTEDEGRYLAMKRVRDRLAELAR